MKVTWKLENRLGTITVDAPPVNALNKEFFAQMDEILHSIGEDCDVVIITGAGEKAFVAGADIKEFPELKREAGIELCKRGQGIFQRIAELKQPVIAAIDGFALGGGLELALACDFRVASRKSQLGLPEVKLGIIPGYGGTQRLARLVGPGKAKQLIFSGEFVSAEEAYRIGLVEQLVDENALAEARKWAQTMMKRGPIAVKAAKRVIDQGLALSLEEGLDLEAEAFGEICLTEDKNEGVAAFFERREPHFQNK
ncbi:enoyl-CoA hydratase/isomerase family protein [Aneurinibacillus aneurinilyticus]|jgi:enoyl-CoA hydratase/carnithine racemase|uniref:Enoyl-CoA hydratase n=2 Tax=Aneurinibacillus aneurinilyticus TaxID=1391 RepID=A0A848CYC0_ANEAE|nr:enoyl-CoA hydratase-related protein [Aneurinibacillus aneurinilyticus]ERI05204.1 putative 3-hydroxybutyryl-CoA dehydratase [Aneurinibacillus aneurinilyticus ATCC 12856]MED0708135.1 enoyl-CoA hydratase-related protein [Aneurinibacillus aneurinilyticus]MED0721512.1 enoyl-CoA hydratase-related protein [Aneurinibacillus aneurinilyticus]MED0734020.1 enoyl-CoA hydratase-related protein [Aneurinibacillus aneurinilyticus]MED0743147.1 enoyl-CoA hydratase-related protein [Aneurinibacillus aneurinilyt